MKAAVADHACTPQLAVWGRTASAVASRVLLEAGPAEEAMRKIARRLQLTREQQWWREKTHTRLLTAGGRRRIRSAEGRIGAQGMADQGRKALLLSSSGVQGQGHTRELVRASRSRQVLLSGTAACRESREGTI